MTLQFFKATYADNTYKLSDFYTSLGVFISNTNKQLSLNIKADDGLTSVITSGLTLPDTTNIIDYTHVLIIEKSKIYRIEHFDYVNENQLQLFLQEDAFLSNYQTLKDINIIQNRTLDSSYFLGTHDVKDIAIKHTASASGLSIPENHCGYWAMLTFQQDVTNLQLTFHELEQNQVEHFDDYDELTTMYPVGDITSSIRPGHFLKVVYIDNAGGTDEDLIPITTGFYQFIDVNGVYSWKKVQGTLAPPEGTGVIMAVDDYYVRTQHGDVGTINVLLPFDMTVARQYDAVNDYWVPLYPIQKLTAWNNTDKLISIKIIPHDLLEIIDIVGETKEFNATKDYFMKAINWKYDTNDTDYVCQIKFKETLSFGLSTPSIGDYEPFKKQYINLFGEVIQIPVRYSNSFNARISITSIDVLYEIYTDKYNVIASGKLNLLTRYQVDKLDLFYAQNPTYKDQFFVQQLVNIGAGTVGGAVTGSLVPGIGTAAGAIVGFLGGVGNAVLSGINFLFQEKGLKEMADVLHGTNDVAMSMLRGFGMYYITIEPESAALTQMQLQYLFNGFPCAINKKISDISKVTNGASFTNYKIVYGKCYNIIKNVFVTNAINEKLAQGVILID